MSNYFRFPATGGSGITTYATFSDFPSSAANGSVALALDTSILYEYTTNTNAWVIIGGAGLALSIGTIDSQTAAANGAVIASNALVLQSASATRPGLVNNTTQSFSGNKTFTGAIGASNLSGTNTGDVTLAAVGSTPSANGASLSSQVLTLQPADATHPGVVTTAAQAIAGAKTFSSAPIFSSVTASQALIVDSGKALASLAYTDANTASTLVQRDASGNFSAGTITSALTGTASGNTTITPGQYGVLLSGTANVLQVLTPDASTSKVLVSGGNAANPAWSLLTNSNLSGSAAITNANLANMASASSTVGTVKGNISGSATTPSDIVLTSANTASSAVYRDSSGNFSAGTITSALTGTASGNTTISANQYGVVLSGTANVLQVLAPDASTAKALISGGSSANPSWGVLSVPGGGTGIASGTSGGIPYFSATNTIASSGALTASQLVLGGGAGATPTVLAAGSQYIPLTMGASAPGYTALALNQTAATSGQLLASRGGTALDTSSSTGVPSISSGTWSVNAQLATSLGGLGGNFGASTGALSISSGTVTAGTLSVLNGGTGQTSTANAFGALSPLTTKGDMLAYGSSNTRLPIGTDGQLVIADSNQTLGLRYKDNFPKNYILNSDAEVGTEVWTTYADAAQNTPVDGTGGSPSSTWTRTTSSPLRGTASFLWTRTANNRQGEGVSYDFTLDAADQAKPIAISFDYKIASGTFVAADGITAPLNDGTTSQNAGMSDLEVFIYDKTNTSLIPVTPQVLTSTSTTSASFKGTFQTSASSTSYRLIIHTARSTAVAFTAQIDNVFVGAVTYSYGYAGNDSTAYTPTTNGLGTVSAISTSWRRTGDKMEIQGVWTNGTVSAATAYFTLPSGYSINTTLLGSGSVLLGTAWRGNEAALCFYDGSTTNQIFFTRGNGTVATFTKQNGSTIWNTSDEIGFVVTVPISGWSSTVQMSNDTDTRVVAAIITGDPASATSGNPIIVPTIGYDSHAGYNATTGRYTVSVSGIYKLYGSLQSASSATTLTIYKNASSSQLAGNLDSNGEATFIGSVSCVAGDIIDIRPGGTVDASNMALTIERLSGPSAIASTESVNFMYGHAAATGVTSITTIAFDTKTKDSHNAVASGIFTAPSAGLYHFDAVIAIKGATFILNDLVQVDLVQAGSASVTRSVKGYAAAAVTQFEVSLPAEMQLAAGDTVKVQVTSARTGSTLSGTVNENWFGGFRIGS